MPLKKVFVAGHNGMVGSAICRTLATASNVQLIKKSRQELNLASSEAVNNFYQDYKPDEVYICAAKVGGIYANTHYPADFIHDNLAIALNLLKGALVNKVSKLLFLGSSCIYPRNAHCPIQEKELLSGPLEPTNEYYALAKIAGIKLCESYNKQYDTDFRVIMPCNLYGPNDNYHPLNSHVIPALIAKFHKAKQNSQSAVSLWGNGQPRREFLHVDDLAAASIFIMNLTKNNYRNSLPEGASHINVGYGTDCSIADLADMIKKTIQFNGDIIFDNSALNGVDRKLMDSSAIRALGWKPFYRLKYGLESTYQAYLQEKAENMIDGSLQQDEKANRITELTTQ